jgi:Protein of unknown function (DUF3716)
MAPSLRKRAPRPLADPAESSNRQEDEQSELSESVSVKSTGRKTKKKAKDEVVSDSRPNWLRRLGSLKPSGEPLLDVFPLTAAGIKLVLIDLVRSLPDQLGRTAEFMRAVPVREVELRKNRPNLGKVSSTSPLGIFANEFQHPQYIEALIAQSSGDLVKDCGNCVAGKGPMVGCVQLELLVPAHNEDGEPVLEPALAFGGACANCAFYGHPEHCPYHTGIFLPPLPGI